MKIDKAKQADASTRVDELLKKSEDERKQRRFIRGAEEFGAGKYQLLENDELAIQLPAHIIELFRSGDDESAIELLRAIGATVVGESEQLRKRAVMVLSLFAEELFSSENEEYLLFFTGLLIEWLAIEKEYISGYEVISSQIIRAGQWLLENRYWQELGYLLQTISDILSGKIKKNNQIVRSISEMQERLGSADNMRFLFGVYANGKERNTRNLEEVLILLSRQFIPFAFKQFDKDLDEQATGNLIGLITKCGGAVAPELRDYLAENPSPQEVHNAIQVTQALGDHDNYPLIEPFLDHEDVAIQREIIECIHSLGGPLEIERLCRALKTTDPQIQKGLVAVLTRMTGPLIGEAFLALLKDIHHSDQFDHTSLLKILVVASVDYPSAEMLEIFEQLRLKFPEIMREGRFGQQVDEIMIAMASQVRISEHTEHGNGTDLSFDEDPLQAFHSKSKTSGLEQEVQNLLGENKTEDAVKLITNKAIEFAQDKDFNSAERLRDRILEIDPQSYAQVLEVEEVLEEEKKKKIPKSFVDLYSGLCDLLDENELEIFFESLEKIRFSPDMFIIREGEQGNRAFFLSKGSVSLSCTSGEKDVFLKRLQPGEHFGSEHFQSVSVWTVTAVSQSNVELYMLSWESFQALRDNSPELTEKIISFCAGEKSIIELIKMAGEERRGYARHAVGSKQKIALLDTFATAKSKSLVSELLDVSMGGYCFIIKIANSNNARLLLGRHVQTAFTTADDSMTQCTGTVVAVNRPKPSTSKFKVHVRLHEPLSADELAAVVTTIGQ